MNLLLTLYFLSFVWVNKICQKIKKIIKKIGKNHKNILKIQF